MYLYSAARRAGLILALALGATLEMAEMVRAQAPAPAPAARAGGLTVSDAWARATPPGARTGAVYMTIANGGSGADRLIAAASPAAASVELHTHIMEGGVARMRAIEAVEVSPGQPVVFQPGGLHVMLFDLRAPLRDGESLSLTLTFARAGVVTLNVPIRRNAPAAQPLRHQH